MPPLANTERLDTALAMRGLARSRSHAVTLIAAGIVRVDGVPALKSSTRVSETQLLSVDEPDHYVSRAARKLLAALESFGVPVEGRLALDAGASTGGFTQVLLERGARAVIAADVGRGQLAASLLDDPRVRSVEGINLRSATREQIAAASGIVDHIDVVTADLSFISLGLVLPALRAIAKPEADFVMLVKPQFEVGRSGVREGIVHDPSLRSEAVTGVLWAAWDAGLGTAGVLSSPIHGTNGNHEYLVWLSALEGTNPTVWLSRIAELTGA